MVEQYTILGEQTVQLGVLIKTDFLDITNPAKRISINMVDYIPAHLCKTKKFSIYK